MGKEERGGKRKPNSTGKGEGVTRNVRATDRSYLQLQESSAYPTLLCHRWGSWDPEFVTGPRSHRQPQDQASKFTPSTFLFSVFSPGTCLPLDSTTGSSPFSYWEAVQATRLDNVWSEIWTRVFWLQDQCPDELEKLGGPWSLRDSVFLGLVRFRIQEVSA